MSVTKQAPRGLGALALALTLAASAQAERGSAGSLVILPEFDHRAGADTLVTVTNTSLTGSVLLQYDYVQGDGCVLESAFEALLPGDTLTLLTSAHTTSVDRGYLVVYAKDTSGAVKFDHLIAQATLVDSIASFDATYEAFAFRAGAALAELEPTDRDGDGRRDFDSLEYEPLPNELLFPRFLAQEAGVYGSDLVLINLTGGGAHDATVRALLWNDNLEVFSTEYTFQCWERLPLSSLSGLFGQAFLAGATNHNSAEIVGLTSREAGWFKLQGVLAVLEEQTTQVIPDPAVLAMLIGRDTTGSSFTELPFQVGTRSSGAFLDPTFVFEPPGVAVCFQTACPCGNTTVFGRTGCRNSSGYGARLDAAGRNVLAFDNLTLVASQAAAEAPGIFLSGGSLVENPLGDGVLCAGNPTRRLEVAFTDLLGNATSTVSLASFANPGDTLIYQFWFREPGSAGPCGGSSNLSNGYRVTWL